MDELSIMEERIQDKIAQTKIKMDKAMQRAETDRLWPIIETLKWVLNEILVVSKEWTIALQLEFYDKVSGYSNWSHL